MHTPDGFITGPLCVILMLLAAAPIVLALRNLRRTFTRQKANMIALVAAVVFLAQMLNFPIAGGTSGHLIGAAFALLVLGVDAAVIAMALVLVVQTFVFGDGGALALGANVFNMAVVGVYAADFTYRRMPVGGNLRVFATAAVSVVAASAVCALELAASGTAPFWAVLQAMVSTHLLIGLGEGILTVALAGVFCSRLENLSLRTALAMGSLSFLALALTLPFASGSPDGLERVAINLGFFGNAIELYSAPLQDYSLAVLESIPYLATLSAALVGSALVFAIPNLMARVSPTLPS